MKKLLLFTIFTVSIFAAFKVPEAIKNIGKPTPIDITLYAKNPSTKCTLTIKNISHPKSDTNTTIEPITIEPGHYFQKEYKNILKGKYEFEYTFSKDGKFIDSFLKTKYILTPHNNKLKIFKKFNPTTLISTPSVCK
jgi:hypothetical protein